jgi:hypothetical protein
MRSLDNNSTLNYFNLKFEFTLILFMLYIESDSVILTVCMFEVTGIINVCFICVFENYVLILLI